MSSLIVERRRILAELFCHRLQQVAELAPATASSSVREALSSLRNEIPAQVIANFDTIREELGLLMDEPVIRTRQCRLVVVGDNLTDVCLEVLLRTGVDGILELDESLDVLLEACRRPARGVTGPVLSPRLLERVQFDKRGQAYVVKRRSEFEGLTLRQLAVLTRIAQGQTVKEIASKMFLSTRAVESHKYRIMRRLQIHDRVELCRFAIREGLIEP